MSFRFPIGGPAFERRVQGQVALHWLVVVMLRRVSRQAVFQTYT